jgi:ABC-2 type transport system permease protein
MVGRRASLTAALLAAGVANAVLAVLVTAGLAGQGTAGALALGLGLAGVGMLFATMAAIVAQLTESARLARGLTAAVLTAGGLAGLRRRDLGMSFLPTRPGPPTGRLGTAAALAWRLQRGGVLGWSVGFFLTGVVYGGLTEGAADLVGDNDRAREIFERMGGQTGLTDAFLASMIGMLGLIAALYVVASVLRLHGEETSGRAEPVLANAVGRLRWAAGHLLIAFGGAALIMLLAGLGFAAGYGKEALPILAACLLQLPAIWLVGGLTLLIYGTAPRLAPAAWGVAGAILLIGWIGPALDAPQTVLNLSPFGHLPKLPGGEMEWPPVGVLLGGAAVLTAGGLAGLRRRDMTT